MSKECSVCGEDKPISEFYRRRASKDGLMPKCKKCKKSYADAYYAKNRERIVSHVTGYARRNREVVNATARKHYRCNAGTIAAQNKARRNRSPDKERARLAVRSALATGGLVRPSTCSECGASGEMDAHHDSYLPKDWLDVRFLCRSCHVHWHKRNSAVAA